MTGIVFEILLILLLIIGNGVFAMSEIAVVSARKARLQQQVNQGNAGARAALKLANSPSRFLATVQIGITLVGILAGAFGGATIAAKLAEALRLVPVLAPYSNALAFGSDHFEWQGLRFEVVDMDGNRVDKVLVTPAHTASRS